MLLFGVGGVTLLLLLPLLFAALPVESERFQVKTNEDPVITLPLLA